MPLVLLLLLLFLFSVIVCKNRRVCKFQKAHREIKSSLFEMFQQQRKHQRYLGFRLTLVHTKRKH
jgi:hypothetical protein